LGSALLAATKPGCVMRPPALLRIESLAMLRNVIKPSWNVREEKVEISTEVARATTTGHGAALRRRTCQGLGRPRGTRYARGLGPRQASLGAGGACASRQASRRGAAHRDHCAE